MSCIRHFDLSSFIQSFTQIFTQMYNRYIELRQKIQQNSCYATRWLFRHSNFCKNLISAGALPQTLLGEFTTLPQTS